MELQFVCKVDGFQHDAEPFTIKKLVFQPLFQGPITAFTLNTDFLCDDSNFAMATYRYCNQLHPWHIDDRTWFTIQRSGGRGEFLRMEPGLSNAGRQLQLQPINSGNSL